MPTNTDPDPIAKPIACANGDELKKMFALTQRGALLLEGLDLALASLASQKASRRELDVNSDQLANINAELRVLRLQTENLQRQVAMLALRAGVVL